MGGGSSVLGRFGSQKSNAEFTASLKANLVAAQKRTSNGHAKGDANGAGKPPLNQWTSRQGDKLFIPSVDFSKSGLAEERDQYEITVKLFFLPKQSTSCRCQQTREAIELVLKELKVPSVDLLIVSYPGITFDAEDEEEDDAVVRDAQQDSDAEDLDTMIKTWGCLEELHDEQTIKRLGVSEFGSARLRQFLARTRIRPGVNQINVRDCCVVPKPLILYAKEERVELLTHNDCFNILPSGTTREILQEAVPADDDTLKGDVEPQYVVKYTAVVKNRGVIENKGYFALAELA